MTYSQTRDDEQLRILQRPIGEFILQFKQNASASDRRTIIFFPGGMGSQLVRADAPYREDLVTPQTFNYTPVWLTAGTLQGDGLKLEMYVGASNDDRDLEDRIILADGVVNLGADTPYQKFAEWCRENHLDLFVFSWDWRRRLQDTVFFFLKKFLPALQKSVIDACGADPLNNLVLIGHSFGGMIVKLIIHDTDPNVARITRAITVASPFYGFGGLLHRFFEGDDLLNGLGKDKVVKVISSFPAMYTLQFLDYRTYRWNRAALLADSEYPIANYPSLDATTLKPADAYRPRSAGPKKVRYPTRTGFRKKELRPAMMIARKVAEPLDDSMARKFFSIRGVQTDESTHASVKWTWIDPLFDPENSGTSTPISDDLNLPGDDTQPAWTARLVGLPAGHVITVTGNIKHICMVDYPETHEALATILGLPKPRRRKRFVAGVKPATSEEALAFVREIQRLPRGEIEVRKFTDAIPKRRLRGLALRIFMDILKRQPEPKKQ
jgi:pimeloyl-ACP methyl ester carboxylesterase